MAAKHKSQSEYQSVNDQEIRDPDNGVAVVEPARKRGRARVNPNESRADRFKRLANKRVPAALKRIQHVASLANASQYEWTDEQRAKIVKVLQDAIAILIERFMGRKAQAESFSV